LFVLFAPDYANLLTPAFVEGEELPFDLWGEVAEDGFCGWVDVKGGGDEVEARWEGREFNATEVSVLVKGVAAGVVEGLCVVVTNADPVVEALEGEVEIVVGFEFDDGEAAVGGDAEEVEQATIGGADDRRDLRVDVVCVEARDDGRRGFGDAVQG